MYIETDLIIIREFIEDDLNDVYEYCSQVGVGELAGWTHHQSIGQTSLVLKQWISEGGKYAVYYKPDIKVVGHISVDPDSEEGRADTRELGFVLNKNYHRKGIMSEVVLQTVKFLFESNIQYIWACCFQENQASKKLIEKCGFKFQQEGTFYSADMKKEFTSYEYRITRS